MNTKKLMLAGLMACALSPALAAEAPAGQQKESTIAGPVTMHPGDANVVINTTMLRMHGKTITNAPYSAQEVMERQQTLADGNQIVNTTTSMSYRDSQGRVRDEHRDRKGELTTITITDPVANLTWVLHPKDKTATRMQGGNAARAAAEAARAAAEASRAGAEAGRAAAAAARARIDELRKEGKLPAVEHGPDGSEIIVKRVQRDNAEGMQHIQENVRIIAKEMTETRMRELSSLGPMLASVGDFRWAGKATTKDLGTRDIAGVKAQGKLRSYEIPAGEIGNAKPIVVSDESWWSPDLQITVYSKHSDPRSGDNIYRVDNLKRDEPAAALFTVPSDYTVKDASFHGPKPPVPPATPRPN
ncbi:MAG: hypothetical protein ACXWC4_00080 [Telluria sp.]